MSAVHLDAVDEKIIILLVEDARRSFADIGGRVGLTASAVKRRVDRLRSGGAIGGFTVRLEPGALGWTVEGYVELYCRASTSPQAIRAAVERFPEIVDASTILARPTRCCGSSPPTCTTSSGCWSRSGRSGSWPARSRCSSCRHCCGAR